MEMAKARNVAVVILTKIIEPVLYKLGLTIGKEENGNDIILDERTEL